METDQRILSYIKVVQRLGEGDFQQGNLDATSGDVVGQLGISLKGLAQELERRYREIQKIDQITTRVNAGLILDDILRRAYRDFAGIIPYNRIGVSLLEEDGRIVRARWAKSDQPHVAIKRGYSAPLEGSSLQAILETGQPRVINDLLEYLKVKPDSISTQLITSEGIRSSLTCPLIANNVPIGFIFFSSIYPNTYTHLHVDIFLRIAGQLSVILEKGRLVSELKAQKTTIERHHRELQKLYARQEEYIQQVAIITKAAADIEHEDFSLNAIDTVSLRTDALGNLARVFKRMAREVYTREQKLKNQVQQLRIDIDQIKRAKQVSEITESEFFLDLKQKVQQIRSNRNEEQENG